MAKSRKNLRAIFYYRPRRRRDPSLAKKMKTHPHYQRVRENNAAFGKAASEGRLLREALASSLKNLRAKNISARLVKVLMTIIKSGTHTSLMEPQVLNGPLELLEDFEFNPKSKLLRVFLPTISVSFKNDNRDIDIEISDLNMNPMTLLPPVRFTHFKMVPIIAAVDFESGKYWKIDKVPDKPVSLCDQENGSIRLSAHIDLPGKIGIIAALGIEFYHTHNEKEFYPVASGGYDLLSIIRVVTT
jgi:hypothetical protein